MPVTQAMNSKGNVKKFTNNDLPFSPQQPVMSSYYATSTAAQTVINLSFSVDQSATDQFFLFVDGKKLRLGSTNDYQFTSIGSDGRSSQVTMNYPLSINLNIQAYNLGLKSEVEFGVDNRFTQLYEAQGNGFQGFISQSTLITPTSATGTPAAGTYHSTVLNRAPIVDLSQNLKANMAVDRIMTHRLQTVQNEFGPNGEAVWAATNDIFGQIRFVGNWTYTTNDYGPFVVTSTVSDYVEVVFYGTGINVLSGSVPSRDWRWTIDGGTENASFVPSGAQDPVLGNRNYNPNIVIPVVKNLTLGIHTLKIRYVSASNMNFHGFEILNESNLVKVTSGVGYSQGKKYTSSALQSFAYNASATGTRGGRVVVYQNGDGTIGRAWQAVNAAQANLTSADHTNEEVIRTYNWREFGAARTDDFSRLNTPQAAAFALDDGTTTLSSNNAISAGVDGFYNSTVSNVTNFTFVGTGLDFVVALGQAPVTFTYTIEVNGTSIGTGQTGWVTGRTVKVVSGLPYGTHTVRFTVTGVAGGQALVLRNFIVYGPKKPSVPSAAIELADYNVMADFDASVLTTNYLTPPVGGLFKATSREILYRGAGTWALDTVAQTYSGMGPQAVFNTANGAIMDFTFTGTGVVCAFSSNSGGTKTYNISIDGALVATGAVFGGATNAGGGSYTIPTGTALARWISFQGLSYGSHTITVQCTDATGLNVIFDGFIVTPLVHSPKSQLTVDFQNTLPVGSQGLSDNRKLTPVKDLLPAKQTWAQAVDQGSNPTTTSSTLIPMPNMSVLVYAPTAGAIDMDFLATVFNTANNGTGSQIYMNGVAVSNTQFVYATSAVSSSEQTLANRVIVPVSAGYHKIDVYWNSSSGGTSTVFRRTLTAQFKA